MAMPSVVKIWYVKKIVCILLVIWFGVLSNWAQAHATHEATHELSHVIEDAALNSVSDAHQDEHCDFAHHCHSVPLLGAESVYFDFEADSQHPMMSPTLTPRFPPPEIERPKWAVATLAVASF